jgi:hypothetical protein
MGIERRHEAHARAIASFQRHFPDERDERIGRHGRARAAER